jgi:hypothetical protein
MKPGGGRGSHFKAVTTVYFHAVGELGLEASTSSKSAAI